MSKLIKKQQALLHRLFDALIQQAATQRPVGTSLSFSEGDFLINDGDFALYDIGNGFVVFNEVSGDRWFFPCKFPEEATMLKDIQIHFDGASEGNPGPSGAGWTITVDDEAMEGIEYLGVKTSNQAEYLAIIRALEEVISQFNPEDVNISILGDSQLVIRHLKGEYQVRSDRLLPLYEQTIELLEKFNEWSCIWVNRAENRKADGLSKKAVKMANKT
ncbi:MAG: ribonuclease HI family protein [Candidatus Hodarchaeales archaeon]|jgi:ribonuclease HI